MIPRLNHFGLENKSLLIGKTDKLDAAVYYGAHKGTIITPQVAYMDSISCLR